MAAFLTPNAKQQFFDNAGAPASGFKLYTYSAGTATPLATYTDRAGTVANANPIILDARGEAIIYLPGDQVYDYVLRTAADVPVWTREGVSASAGNVATLGFTQSGTGSVLRTLQGKLLEFASVLDFIPVAEHAAILAGSSTYDCTAGFNAAILAHDHVKVPPGRYTVLGNITMGLGKHIYGNRRKSIVYVPANHPLTGNGIFIFTGGQPGPTIHGLTIRFVQPDVATLGAMTAYPPAIYAVAVPRFQLRDLRIEQAYNGIVMTGNSGAAVIDDLELSAYNMGIQIDGSLDSIKFTRIHWWPFASDTAAMTTNQRTVFQNATGIRSGKNDDFHLSDSLFFSTIKTLEFYESASGMTFGQVTNCDFDDRGGIVGIDDARVSFSGCTFTIGTKGDAWVCRMSGGNGPSFTFDGCRFSLVNGINAAANGFMEISAGLLQIGPGCTFDGGSSDKPFIYCSGGVAKVNGPRVTRNQVAFATPMFHFLGTGRGQVANCEVSDKGAGSGNFVLCGVDNAILISNNQTGNWSISLPATSINIQPSGNWPVTASYSPVLVNGANVASSTTAVCHFKRDGDTLFMWGRTDVTPTANTTDTIVGIPLPPGMASNFTLEHDVVGFALNKGATINTGYMRADTTNDRLQLVFVSNGTTSVAFNWEAKARIK